VLVDLPNDNVHPDGAHASFGAADHAQEQHLAENAGTLLAWARASSVPVITTTSCLSVDGNSVAPMHRSSG
jgi:nicotinamidase-related amidase